MRVETEEGAYTGRLRFDDRRESLREAIDDHRAYLALWDAIDEATGSRDEYVAIHKSVIRSVVLLGAGGEGGAQPGA